MMRRSVQQMTSIGSCVLAVMNQPGSESECAGTATTRSTSRGWKAEQGRGEVLDLEINLRRGGMPLGVSMEDSRGRITISEIQAGSIADGNFHYGDVMTHVNGKRVTDIKSARPAILEAINNNKSLTIRVERPEQLGEVSHLPADVARIIKQIFSSLESGRPLAPPESRFNVRQRT
uniref:PDZ domain-containing protein n=1 Tax=Meloidogyne incognita TaxID=6306 RepID=A0A914NV52_MELIC